VFDRAITPQRIARRGPMDDADGRPASCVSYPNNGVNEANGFIDRCAVEIKSDGTPVISYRGAGHRFRNGKLVRALITAVCRQGRKFPRSEERRVGKEG